MLDGCSALRFVASRRGGAVLPFVLVVDREVRRHDRSTCTRASPAAAESWLRASIGSSIRMRPGQIVWRRNLVGGTAVARCCSCLCRKRAQPVGDLSAHGGRLAVLVLRSEYGGTPCNSSHEWCDPSSRSSCSFRAISRLDGSDVIAAADLLAMYRSWDDEMVRYKIAIQQPRSPGSYRGTEGLHLSVSWRACD